MSVNIEVIVTFVKFFEAPEDYFYQFIQKKKDYVRSKINLRMLTFCTVKNNPYSETGMNF